MSIKINNTTKEIEDTTFIATLETCRLCLKNGAKINIFNSKKYALIPQKITNCFRLKVSKNDGMPEKICKGCVSQICKYAKFKSQCERADRILRKTLNLYGDHLLRPKEELENECSAFDGDSFCGHDSNVKTEFKDEIAEQDAPVEDLEPLDSINNKIEHADDVNYVFKNGAICNENSKSNEFSNSYFFLDKSSIIDKITPKTSKTVVGAHSKAKIKKLNTTKNNSDGKAKQTRDRSSASNLCPICGKIFVKASLLSNHLERHGTEKKFICSICSKAFVTKSQLQKHITCHLPNRDYTCETCGKTFKTNSHAKMHIETVHKKLKAVTCQLCQKEFICMRNLKMHMKIHTGEKEHQCEFCARKFTFKISLTLHRRIHTGEKPYACRFCESKFAVSKTLKEHERLHTGETPYLCPVCNKGFMQKSNMKSHFRNNHKNFSL